MKNSAAAVLAAGLSPFFGNVLSNRGDVSRHTPREFSEVSPRWGSNGDGDQPTGVFAGWSGERRASVVLHGIRSVDDRVNDAVRRISSLADLASDAVRRISSVEDQENDDIRRISSIADLVSDAVRRISILADRAIDAVCRICSVDD